MHVYLGASNNNKSSTVLNLFLEATQTYGFVQIVEEKILMWLGA